MKKAFLAAACLVLAMGVSSAQDTGGKAQKDTLKSESLDQVGKKLDEQISEMNKKMAEIISTYELIKSTGIRWVPYQMNLILGKDFIEMEKHSFTKDGVFGRDITGIQSRKMKIYTDGKTISRIESEIYERDYYAGTSNIVRIVDPSPMAQGTDNVTFTNIINGKIYIDNKRLGDIKNTTAFPIRNDLKREFFVPHLSFFRNSMLFIAESHMKGLKDSEHGMAEFLRKAKQY
ncbi:MAG: hypothetical protein E4G96_06620 [Chrysiogenales bacterium]|nr:MAG: hypothetical protein E4G96_06620 [Chrysiogenales bacterium]